MGKAAGIKHSVRSPQVLCLLQEKSARFRPETGSSDRRKISNSVPIDLPTYLGSRGESDDAVDSRPSRLFRVLIRRKDLSFLTYRMMRGWYVITERGRGGSRLARERERKRTARLVLPCSR